MFQLFSHKLRVHTKTTDLFQVGNDKEIVVVHLFSTGVEEVESRGKTTLCDFAAMICITGFPEAPNPWHCSNHRYAMAIIYLSDTKHDHCGQHHTIYYLNVFKLLYQF